MAKTTQKACQLSRAGFILFAAWLKYVLELIAADRTVALRGIDALTAAGASFLEILWALGARLDVGQRAAWRQVKRAGGQSS